MISFLFLTAYQLLSILREGERERSRDRVIAINGGGKKRE